MPYCYCKRNNCTNPIKFDINGVPMSCGKHLADLSRKIIEKQLMDARDQERAGQILIDWGRAGRVEITLHIHKD